MRYEADHKEQTRRRIVDSASRQFRAEGMRGPGVAKLMKASGLTVGGFYKHFRSKDDLVAQAVDASVRDIGKHLIEPARQAPAGQAWKQIVKRYLSIEHCEHPGTGCPMAALAPDIARARRVVKRKIRDSMEDYKKQLIEFMPGSGAEEKQKNFALLFTAMVGALSVARTMTDTQEKERLLSQVREHLLGSF